MITIVLPQSFLSDICNRLADGWLTKESLQKTFNPSFVDAFFEQYQDYLSEGEDEGITYFTLGLGDDESEFLIGKILAANQKRLELK